MANSRCMPWPMPAPATRVIVSTFRSSPIRLNCFRCCVKKVTENIVMALFEHRQPTAVQRYVLPKLNALNFVLDGVLDGGVTQALNLDAHGKTQSYRLLGLSVEVPEDLMRFAKL